MKTESVWTKYSEKQLKELEKLSADYRTFLDEGKTERECVSYIVNRIENEGYVELAKLLKSGKKIKAGAKVPATGHNWVETSRTEATCSEDGSITYVCKNDSTHTKTETIPATGAHHDDDNDGFCDDCHTEYNPSHGHDGCICHKDNVFSKVIRYLCTLLTKLFHKRISCCDDMEYYKGGISSIT